MPGTAREQLVASVGDASSVAGQWQQRVLDSFSQSPPLAASAGVIALILAAVIVLAVWRPGWRFFGLYVTVVHELGHAFSALLTGQRLTGIRVNADHSGTTHSMGRPGWRFVWSGFCGYPAPAVVGAALIWCALHGWQSLALVIGAVVIALTLLFIRNIYGAFVVLVCFLVAAALALYADPEIQGYVVTVLGLGLLVGAVRDWFNVASVHLGRGRSPAASDAYILYRQTRIPSAVWLFLFALVIAVCLGVSAMALGALL